MNGGALFNAEFGIRHSGSTVPERSGVALSFCRRRIYSFCAELTHYNFRHVSIIAVYFIEIIFV
ncbi:hypothetical protein C3F42_17355 [Pseudomonas sp. PONIH3]|nr:hypothetical protein C3F42_17355 [Pseudomonas sp. PONIH3]